MPYTLLFCCLLLGIGTSLHAQDPHRHDTIPFGEWRQEIVRAPVLTGGSQPIIILPNTQPFCFDKRLDLKMAIGHTSTQQFAFLDTRNGLSGTLPPSRGSAVEEIMPEIDHFTFTVMSLKGNVYTYKTQKGKQDALEHWVSTGNTQNSLYQSPTASNPGSGVALVRKSEQRVYCGNKINATAYRYDGSPNTFFLYGNRFPDKLHPVKYLGVFGVGYLFTQEGLYLIMELNFGANYVRISDMENVHTCFNPSGFQSMEDRFQARGQEDLQKEKAKTDQEQAHITGDCTQEKQAIVDFKKALNQKHEELLRKSQHGNLYQDTMAQRAMLSLSDPLYAVQQSILNARLRICGAQSDMARNPRNAPADGAKVQCLNDQVAQLQNAESRMMALDRQYVTQLARGNAEKSKLYLELMKTLPRCD
jgi:hypothetical protein